MVFLEAHEFPGGYSHTFTEKSKLLDISYSRSVVMKATASKASFYLAITFLVPTCATADVLHLKNGDRIIGTIKRVWDNEVTIDGRDNTIIKTTTGFRYEITDLLYMNVSLDWDHESEPAGAAEKTDTTFVIGAGLEFD